MQTTHVSSVLLALLLSAATAARAAAPAPAAPVPLTFGDGHGTIELIERLRYEDRANNFDFDAASHSPTDDSWLVQRLRLGVTWKEAGWSAQVQLQDSREWGSERPGVPFILGAEGNDTLDLRLAAVTIGDVKKGEPVFTLGRQILALGDERLVGPSEWNNFARTFDAAKAVWVLGPRKTTATLFTGSVVNVEERTPGSGWRFDHSSANDWFSGLNLNQKLDGRQTAEGYVLWRNKRNNDPIFSAPTAPIPAAARTAAAYDIGQDVYTVGVRYVNAPKEGAFDSELEADWQGGEVNRQTTAATGVYSGNRPTLKQRAWALHALVGYTPAGAPGKLRFDVEYNVASGDQNRTDGTNGSFMSLFPSTHKQYYSLMDVFALKNLREVTLTARCSPFPKTTLRADYHVFSLYSAQDAWYRANGVSTVRPLSVAAQHASTRAGDEFDLTFTWAPQPWLALDAGYAKLWAGSYLAATGAHSAADFFYVQMVLKR